MSDKKKESAEMPAEMTPRQYLADKKLKKSLAAAFLAFVCSPVGADANKAMPVEQLDKALDQTLHGRI